MIPLRLSGRVLGLMCIVSAGLTGCPVDGRSLEPQTPNRGGTSAGGAIESGTGGTEGGTSHSVPSAGAAGEGTNGGSAQSAGTGGAPSSGGIGGASASAGAGVAGGSPNTRGIHCVCGVGPLTSVPASAVPQLERCPDLDGNLRLDCDETALTNSTFDADVRGWSEEIGLTLTWSDVDAHGKETSGSLAVDNRNEGNRDGDTMSGASQCIDATGGALYRLAAELLISDAPEEGGGGLQLIFHDDVACAGHVIDNSTASSLAGPWPAWKVLTLTQRAPASAKSATIRLVAMKPFRRPSFRVIFDNVLVRAE
jgi:hypothetical protein